MFGIANIVAGGPIYNCNKIKYLKENGWNVIVFPIDSGRIYIKPLEQYSDRTFPFIKVSPFFYSQKEREKKIDLLASNVSAANEIIIETGTDFTALWGELLAERLGAKHIIFFLDEKNEQVNKYTAPFYRFKYERGELASISMKSLTYIFGPHIDLREPEKHILSATCSNAVCDIESDIVDKTTV